MTAIYGLTGGIAAGKSTVARLFEALGARVVDADQLAREVVLPGSEGLAEIVRTFGKDVLATDGSLDRKKLGALVFGDDEKRRALEQSRIPASLSSRCSAWLRSPAATRPTVSTRQHCSSRKAPTR